MAESAKHGATRRHAVVTGASQGLGRALVDAFLAHGYAVSFCARRRERVEAILTELRNQGWGDRVCGACADVTSTADMDSFWQTLTNRFGAVTVWINNAGYAQGGGKFTLLSDEAFRDMLTTNLVGTAIACRVALVGLQAQGSGALYNVGGAGSDGRYVPGMLGYGTTKCALQYLTDGLAIEQRGSGVIVGSISPGLVLTEAVARGLPHIPSTMRPARFAFMNAIAELPSTSAAWIVARVTQNTRNGARFVWLTRSRLFARQLQRRFRPRKVLAQWAAEGGPDLSAL